MKLLSPRKRKKRAVRAGQVAAKKQRKKDTVESRLRNFLQKR